MRRYALISGLLLAALATPALAQQYHSYDNGSGLADPRYPAPGSSVSLPDEVASSVPLYDRSQETQGFDQERKRRVEEQERLQSVFTEGRFSDDARATTGGRLVGP